MSIVTKTGDAGETSLYFGQRVPKDDARVEAYGTVDELNSALGLARALARIEENKTRILKVQLGLVRVMGELATPHDKIEAYRKQYPLGDLETLLHWVDEEIQVIEAALPPLKGWAMPGGSLAGAALDSARTQCRRAERRVVSLSKSMPLDCALLITLLNRMSDFFWLMERLEDETN